MYARKPISRSFFATWFKASGSFLRSTEEPGHQLRQSAISKCWALTVRVWAVLLVSRKAGSLGRSTQGK